VTTNGPNPVATADAAAVELDLENLLLRLPHVLGVRVKLGADGSLERIHVLANRAASREGLRAEVERLLEERRALRLDPGVVSVVALETASPPARREPPRPEPRRSRIELRRVAFQPVDDLRVRASADLELDGIRFSGQVTEPDAAPARPLLAGRAVVAGLEYLREHGVAFSLLGVDFVRGFRTPVALALVEAVATGRPVGARRSLTGCAFVRDSREDAAARATLSAVNRLLGILRATP
jgi:hypothetical protein